MSGGETSGAVLPEGKRSKTERVAPFKWNK